MQRLLLARHARSRSNARDVVSCAPPGEGLAEEGREQALALGAAVAAEPIGLGVSSRLLRTRETLDLALTGRAVPRLVVPELDEIHFGRFEGGPLADYRDWAWSTPPDAVCPEGESRTQGALRFARGLDVLLDREEEVVLAVSHALPIHYVLSAARGDAPSARIGSIPNAVAFDLSRAEVERAAASLRAWAASARFADTPNEG